MAARSASSRTSTRTSEQDGSQRPPTPGARAFAPRVGPLAALTNDSGLDRGRASAPGGSSRAARCALVPREDRRATLASAAARSGHIGETLVAIRRDERPGPQVTRTRGDLRQALPSPRPTTQTDRLGSYRQKEHTIEGFWTNVRPTPACAIGRPQLAKRDRRRETVPTWPDRVRGIRPRGCRREIVAASRD